MKRFFLLCILIPMALYELITEDNGTPSDYGRKQ